ncbi:MAG TPA: hypothetical protein VLE70_18330 [Anaerolineae bacterium]|jgi:hypothetical protein|nr:hypothetical protein [Anaerolineae bacterium]
MAYFDCPDCATAWSLRIVTSITLPPDSRSDDILLQIVRCGSCSFRGAAIYEESRRGNPDSEAWDHRGYRLGDQELADLQRLIASCSTKKDKSCRCSAHRALSQKNEYGRWQPPFATDWNSSFPMRRSR